MIAPRVVRTVCGLLYDVRLLLVPNQNDSEEDLRITALWLLGVDPARSQRLTTFCAFS